MNFGKLLSWIPGWLGFLALILIGAAMLINGIINSGLDHSNTIGFIVFGACAAAIGVFSWVVGSSSKIKGKVGKVGVKVAVGDMPMWGWIVDFAILTTAVVLFFILR